MTEQEPTHKQELREKIAKIIFYKIHPISDTFPDYWGITGTMDDKDGSY